MPQQKQRVVVQIPVGVSVKFSIDSANGQPPVEYPRGNSQMAPTDDDDDDDADYYDRHPESQTADSGNDQVFTPTRVIDGHPFCDLAHITPDAHLDVIREVVHSVAMTRPDSPLRIVEIGPWVGASTIALAQGLGPAGGFVFSIDTWNGTPGGYLSDVVESEGGWQRVYERFKLNLGSLYNTVVKPVRMISLRAIAELDVGLVDMVFYDGSYVPAEVVDNLRGWISRIKPDGMLVGQAVGPDSQVALTAATAVLGQFGQRLLYYDGTSVWGVERKSLVDRPAHAGTKPAAASPSLPTH